jgi:ABC-type polysaccharide/polyol phosphate transport system ATPase subunit
MKDVRHPTFDAYKPVICFEHVSKQFVVQIDRPRSFQEVLVSLFQRRAPRQVMTALDDVSFTVQPGQTLGVIGANGAGKSTLLKLISRILEPSVGQIHVHGRVSALLELGAGFHPDLSGRENVYLNGSILGLSRRQMDQCYASIVRFAELERFIDTPVKHYSSGMYMRLGFSIAVHVDPDILLIDEVLAVGDQAFQQKCLDRIQRFRRQGKTIVFVSHDLGAVTELCDQVLWLEDGRMMGAGSGREMVDRYLLSVHAREDAALAAEQTQRAEPQPDRWGTREVEITAVRMLNRHGRQSYVFESGEPAVIEIDYRVNRPVEPPVFGIAIVRNDGVWCYGTNTDIDAVPTDYLEDTGTVRVHFPSLALLEGQYTLDVAVHHRNEHPYDYIRAALTFAMRSRIPDIGVFRPEHEWSVNEQSVVSSQVSTARWMP